MYLTEKDTRVLLSILAKKLRSGGYAKVPPLSSIDGYSSEFKHLGILWDVGHILAASQVSWKKLEKWFKEEMSVLE